MPFELWQTEKYLLTRLESWTGQQSKVQGSKLETGLDRKHSVDIKLQTPEFISLNTPNGNRTRKEEDKTSLNAKNSFI